MDVKSFILLLQFAFCVCFEPFAKTTIQGERALDSEFVSQFVSEVIKSVRQNYPTRVNDVASIQLGAGDRSKFLFAEIIANVSKEQAVINAPIQKPVSHQSFRIASVIVIFSDIIDSNVSFIHISLNRLAQPFLQSLSNFYKSGYFQNDVRIVYIATRFRKKMLNNLARHFKNIGVLNYVILYRDQVWKVFTFNEFNKHEKMLNASSAIKNIDLLFPDKLRDMHGYAYKLAITNQKPRLPLKKGRPVGIDESILSEITRHQNARMEIAFVLPVSDPERIKKIYEILTNRRADLTLNTFYEKSEKSTNRRHVNTYDVADYCALIPIPNRLSFLNFLLSPFDALSWIFMILSIIVCGFVWKLLRRRFIASSSAWHFIIGVIANFFSQSVPFRTNRRIQTTLLQLCILMTFIMGNAFQSVIISFISASREGIRMKTINELFESNLKMKVDPRFYRILANSGDDYRF